MNTGVGHRCPHCDAFAIVYAHDATVFHTCPKLADRAPSRRMVTFVVEHVPHPVRSNP